MKKSHLVGLFVVVLLGIFVIASFGGDDTTVTGNVIAQESSSEVLEIKGSDTLLQLVSNIAEEYSKENPDVKVSVTGGGSGTGIAALLNGEVGIADSSRAIKDEEVALARENGIEPVEVIIARDMLSVIVNEDNDASELTMDEVSAIFRGEITNWEELGGKDMDITLYGRQSTSGTYVFFLEEVVKGEYSPSMRNLEGNQAILEAVRQDESGISYVGLGYVADENGEKVSGINVVGVSSGGEFVSPLEEDKHSIYPISRPLYQYLSRVPQRGSAEYEFVMFELSEQGQEIAKQTGFVGYTSADAEQNSKYFG